MAQVLYSKAIYEKAAALVAISEKWAYGTRLRDGMRFVTFSSQSRVGVYYMTRLDGRGCTCPAASTGRTGRCFHKLACEIVTKQAGEALMEPRCPEGPEDAPVPTFRSYQELYPGCIDGCGDLSERRNSRCYACEQKHVRRLEQESKRAAVAAGV